MLLGHRSECSRKKVIGKPCTGKLYARFDEGELEKRYYLVARQFSTLHWGVAL